MAGPVLRLGFAGLGQAVQRILVHDREIFEQPYKIAAAADSRPEAREAFRREFSEDVHESIEALCQNPNVDVVYVATPAESHRKYVVMAAEHGKHVIVDKPMALDVADCEAMIQAAERNHVCLLSGHTHGFDTPIVKMSEIVRESELGELISINSWMFNEFNPRPWPSDELRSTEGPLFNQGPHHADIIRQIGGGMARSVRATTIWDSLRQCVGGYSCYLEFESGAPATMIYDARGFFDIAELYGQVGEGGDYREPERNSRARQHFEQMAQLPETERERLLELYKDQGRFGGTGNDPEVQKLWGYGPGHDQFDYHKFFGLTLVNCDRGAIRQSPEGLLIYDRQGCREVPLAKGVKGRAAELTELYNAIVHGKPLFHDGRWGLATLEVCFAILQSGREKREIQLTRQVSAFRR